MRLPLTIWGLLTSSIISLLVFPVLLAAGVLLLADRLLSVWRRARVTINSASRLAPRTDATSGSHQLRWAKNQTEKIDHRLHVHRPANRPGYPPSP